MYEKNEKDFGLLLLILKMCDDIKLYQEDYKIIELIENRMSINALLMNIMQIGENANKFSKEFLENFDKNYWLQIINIRHRITHDYGGVDLAIIEKVLRYEIDSLTERVLKILETFKIESLYGDLITDSSFNDNFQSVFMLGKAKGLQS